MAVLIDTNGEERDEIYMTLEVNGGPKKGAVIIAQRLSRSGCDETYLAPESCQIGVHDHQYSEQKKNKTKSRLDR